MHHPVDAAAKIQNSIFQNRLELDCIHSNKVWAKHFSNPGNQLPHSIDVFELKIIDIIAQNKHFKHFQAQNAVKRTAESKNK